MSGELTPLHRGIAAVKAQDFKLARQQLIHAISLEPMNAEPWLWLGVIAANCDERIQYLEQAVSLQPDNLRALKLLHTLRLQQIDSWMKAGITAIQAGEISRGKQLLTKVIQADDSQLEAWWWLGQVSESSEDKIICYENILTLDPDHAGAHLALQALKHIDSVVATGSFVNDDVLGSDESTSLDLTAPDTVKNGKPRQLTTPMIIHESETRSLSSVWLCPFCAAETTEKNQKCSNCKHNLYVQQRLITRPRPQYRILVALEGAIILSGILLPLLMLGFIDMFIDTQDIFGLLSLYISFNRHILPMKADIALAIIQPMVFYLAFVPALIGLVILVCILSRWQPLYYIALGFGSVRILVCILNITLAINSLAAKSTLTPQVASGGLFIKPAQYSLIGATSFVIILALIAFRMLINMHDHFLLDNRRRLLQIDRDVSGSVRGLQHRARIYTKEKAWALAALHARESLVYKQEVVGYILLITAYLHLGWHGEVENTIEEALNFAPLDKQLLELSDAFT
jgi:tetratricopeptide (TPR) repeat protein